MEKKSTQSCVIAPSNTSSDPILTSEEHLTTQNTPQNEQVENGVRLVNLEHQGENWLLGSTTPNWRNILSKLDLNPSSETLQELKQQGLWLSKEKKPNRVSIVCSGQGGVWMHMGRELYNTFPAARDAMDRIATLASWDILALMDETDQEKITRTRWQMPYIFLLSYAHACYLESMGFKPDLYSGHSLGEIISLFLAEAFPIDDAWRLFDGRAALIDDLEQKSTKETGMMAVYAPFSKIEETLQTFPQLHISNYNTPTQYILSGPRDMLTEAKKYLRKQKVPAVLLNVSMAFHHESLNVVRKPSIEGLHTLKISAPTTPCMSCVTADLYPSERLEICEYMADLDEKSVRWVECVQNMWSTHNIQTFVEIGPTDGIGGLIHDIEPRSHNIAVCRKGREVESMRNAVAELYSLGYIKHSSTYSVPDQLIANSPITTEQTNNQASQAHTNKDNPHVEAIIPILMEVTGFERHKLAPHMDLRHDLAMRSSRFPVIINQFEHAFDIQINFEDLINVSTVGDLANAVAKMRSLVVQEDTQSKNEIAKQDEAAQDNNAIHNNNSKSWHNFLLQAENTAHMDLALAQDMQNYPHIFPQEFTTKPSPSFKARRNFSIFSDKKLQEQHEKIPTVTWDMQLDALYKATNKAFSWLNIYGCDDVIFENSITCPYNVTRESQIIVQAEEYIDTKKALKCQATLNTHDITANGRRMQQMLNTAKANILLTDTEKDVSPLWQDDLQELLSNQIIKENFITRKIIAEQEHYSYNFAIAYIDLIAEHAVPEYQKCSIESIANIRHLATPVDGSLRMLWQLQNIKQGYNINAALYSESGQLYLTVQGLRINHV